MRKTRRRKPLKAGTRVRLKTRTVDGWKGTGTVIWDVIDDEDDALVKFRPDGGEEWEQVLACRYQVAVWRDQTPPKMRDHKSEGRG